MSRTSPNERLAILEQKVSHMEEELDRMAAKVDEMHAILLQARGVRWAIIACSGLVGLSPGLRIGWWRGCEGRRTRITHPGFSDAARFHSGGTAINKSSNGPASNGNDC